MSEPRNSKAPKIVNLVGNHEPATKEIVATLLPEEIDGRGSLDPTRYGDWEKNGRCIDF